MPTKKLSTLQIKRKSTFLGRGEQGEVRSFVDPDPKGKKKVSNPFGQKRGQAVKIIHSNGFFRPRTFFNTFLAEPRTLDSVRKMKLQMEVHNIVDILFPGHVVRIPLIRFSQEAFKRNTNLNELDANQIVPELYMSRIEEPTKLKELKKEFYDKLNRLQAKMQQASLAERLRLGQELTRLRLQYDPLIGKRYPQIYELEKEIESAGFDIQHPEVNFGFTNGQVTFYDLIPRVDLNKLRQYLESNPEISEKQKRLVLRRIEAIERLGFTAEELRGRIKTYFDSISQKGLDVLKQILKSNKIPKTKEELHEIFNEAYQNDFFQNGRLSLESITSAISTIRYSGIYVAPSGRSYTKFQLGNNIFLRANVPQEMISETLGTDIGLPVIKLVPKLDPNGRPIAIDLERSQITTLDINYLIQNNLLSKEEMLQLYS